MKSTMAAVVVGLVGAIALAAPAPAQKAKRVAFLDGPIADKYIGGMTRGFTDTAKAAGLDVSIVQSPFDPALQAQQLDNADDRRPRAFEGQRFAKAGQPFLHAEQGADP